MVANLKSRKGSLRLDDHLTIDSDFELNKVSDATINNLIKSLGEEGLFLTSQKREGICMGLTETNALPR